MSNTPFYQSPGGARYSYETPQGDPPAPRRSRSESGSAATSPPSSLTRATQVGMSPRQTNVSIFSGFSSTSESPTASLYSGPGFSTFSPGTVDRVFPIRSTVSVNPNATPMQRGGSGDGFPGMSLRMDDNIATRRAVARNASRASEPSSGSRSSASSTLRGSSQIPTPAEEFRIPTGNYYSPNMIAQSRTSTDTNISSSRLDPISLSNMMAEKTTTQSEDGTSTDGGVSVRSAADSGRESLASEGGLLTARFKHVVTDGGHAVITGRGGETLQRCEDEPIRIPGAVQSFGLLIALKEEEERLKVRVVSENSLRIIGYTPQQLFKLDSFLDIFSDEQAENFFDHLDFIRGDDQADPAVNGPEVFMISIRIAPRRSHKLWCAIHVNETNRDLIICEFEVEDDMINPLIPFGEQTPEPPEDTLGSDPTPEELAESTVNMSKPLRVLRSARKKKGEAAAMEVFNIMSQVQQQLASAPNLEVFLRVLIGVVKELSGFHRVMIYQFDQSWNGRVVAELVDPRATKDLYKGLNFPASDIPQQARDLYKINKVRLLYDRDQDTSRLVCRTMEDLENPLDMTYCYLRAMSPIHLKYLANMAVRSSMSISINAFDELWGLIACHSYGSKGMRVSFPIRKMCRLVGDTASRNIERLSYASRLQARKLINTVPTVSNPSGYIVASSDDLLKLFDADVGALSIRDETKILGKSNQHLNEVLAMVEFLRLRRISSVLASPDINTDFPDLDYAPGLQYLAGLLFVPLSTGGNDFIVFFRQGVSKEVKWAGNPYEKFVKEGTEGYLEPRKSFKTWSETVVGRCRDWNEEEIETAAVLCLVYGKFIDVWRQKEVALQNSQLTKLLLANSAHEVRTPLNAIINYLEIAMEGSLDQETRDNLARSHSASKSLVYVINDLLDLTKAEVGQDILKDEPFDLRAALKEATDPFRGDAQRKNIDYEIFFYEALPTHVLGDPRRVRQVVSNLVANAIEHTGRGGVKVDIWVSSDQPSPQRVDVEIAIEDSGAGMSQSKIDALFRELEEITFEIDDIIHSSPEKEPAQIEGKSMTPDRTALGLGLAVVARTIRAMNGQLRLKSEEGKGSCFVVQLGFDMANKYDPIEESGREPPSGITASTSLPTTPAADVEVTLIDRSSSRERPSPGPHRILNNKKSMESMNSVNSNKSQTSLHSVKSGNTMRSHKSDVERLIDAIQEPHIRSETEAPSHWVQEKPSKRSSGGSHVGSQARPHPRSAGSFTGRDLKSSFAKLPGQENITDSGTPVKAVRLLEDQTIANEPVKQSKVVWEIPDEVETQSQMSDQPLSTDHLSILVAEDDPINSKIMKKRLERFGHHVHLTVNGEDCAGAHGEKASSYDVVLMDLQMPIVDGFTSTKMIRSSEKIRPSTSLSKRASLNGRIPIFAVSASLVERERQKYIDTGFDGWILKPVDFKRLNLILKGLVSEDDRSCTLYEQGKWEQGGWFKRTGSGTDVFTTNTVPTREPPTSISGPMSVPYTKPDPS